jgi:hypothetical protein
MLDLSNILTVTIYSIPSVVKSAPCQTTNEEGELGEPCKIITEFKFFAKDPAAYDSCPIIGNVVCIKTQNLEAKANSPHAILSGIVYNHAHLRYLARVVKPFGGPMESASVMGRLPQLLTFTLLSALVVFFSVALLFPVLAMVVVFMVRIPIIWLTVAFMPLTFIGVVAGEYMSILNPKKIFDVFAKAAFLPVIVAIPFSVGFLMLNVAMSEPNQNLSVDLNLPTGVPLIAGVKDPWQLLWVGMAIAVVWWGAFKALTWDESFAKLVSPIQNAGASFGRFLFKLPLLLPLPLPAPEGSKSPNILQALRVMREPDRTLISPSGELQTTWKNIWGMSGPNLPPDLSRQAQTLATQLQENSRHLNTLTAAMQRVNGATGEDQQRAATTDLKNAVREALREGGVTWNGTSQDLRVLFNDVWRNRLTPDRQRVVPQLNEANLRD